LAATFYTPDFAVLADDGVIECHEVKGVPAELLDDVRARIAPLLGID
jgi:hypothetical protein